MLADSTATLAGAQRGLTYLPARQSPAWVGIYTRVQAQPQGAMMRMIAVLFFLCAGIMSAAAEQWYGPGVRTLTAAEAQTFYTELKLPAIENVLGFSNEQQAALSVLQVDPFFRCAELNAVYTTAFKASLVAKAAPAAEAGVGAKQSADAQIQWDLNEDQVSTVLFLLCACHMFGGTERCPLRIEARGSAIRILTEMLLCLDFCCCCGAVRPVLFRLRTALPHSKLLCEESYQRDVGSSHNRSTVQR